MTMTRSTYSEKLRAVLDEIRPAFRDLGQGLDRLTQKRAELAPAFMKAYAVWRRETHRPFIAFVHELDRSMPVTDRTAYRSHPSYRAAEYLKQLAATGQVTWVPGQARTVRVIEIKERADDQAS